jgi:hypothetical protein
MTIYEAQNLDANLKLLAAQRQLYGQAKRWQHWREAGTIVLAAIAPLIYYLSPNSRTILAFVGAAWLLISRLLLESVEKEKIKQAATIQEQFDTNLFALPWNRVLVGNKISPEIVNSAATSYKGDKQQLRNWYPDTSSMPYPLDVLICQRAGLVWDWRLRQHYAWIVIILTILVFSFGILVGIVTNSTLLTYFLALLIPSLAAIMSGVEIAKTQFSIAEEKKQVEKVASAAWNEELKNPNSVSKDLCRDIQDSIYLLRNKKYLISDILYEWLQRRYEFDMQAAAEEFKLEAEKKLRDSESPLRLLPQTVDNSAPTPPAE